MNRYKCMSCHWSGDVNEIRKELAAPETILEPEEWMWFCPDCNRIDNFEPIEEILCRHCSDEVVQHEDDLCPECYTEQIEAQADTDRELLQ